MGIFDRILGKKKKAPGRDRYDRDRYYEDEYDDGYQDKGPEPSDDPSLLVDHHFEYLSTDDYDRYISSMEYVMTVENTTDYPMGNIRVEFPRSTKLGSFGEPDSVAKLLDPGDRMEVKVPFKPSYQGGKEEFEFDIVFFDFDRKEETYVTLKSEPVKVVVPKFQQESLDEDSYRFLTGDLYRWATETEVIKMDPKVLYNNLKERLETIGFKEANEMINETLFRGITQLAATDKKGRKWAAQVQVIGGDGQAKLLLYTFGERPQYAYNLAVKLLLKLEGRDTIIDGLLPQ